MKLADKIEIKGNFRKQRNQFISKDSNIISKRKGSIVQVKDNKVSILADVTGIDKVYFEIKNNKVRISDRFKDFLDNGLNNEFMQFQEEEGYVPYPFTILKNVRKAPPGLITKIEVDKKGKLKIAYEQSKELEIFNINKKFNKREFKDKLKKLFLQNFKGKSLVSSFSGGFDSLLLTEIYRKKCSHILHFKENNEVDVDYYKKLWPKMRWTIIRENQEFSEDDKQKYFQAVDEPSCDSAGFAEYLMAKKIAEKRIAMPIMNGQGADGLFCSGRMYFRNHISSTFKYPLKNMRIDKKIKLSLIKKLNDYGISTKQRFYQLYLADFKFSEESIEEFEALYSSYENSINNDSTNFYAALIVLLRYSLHGVEKIKTASRAFNAKYYLPFMSENVIQYAFSAPSKYKVNYKTGKKILIESHPYLKKIKFISGAFLPNQLKKSFIGKSFRKNYESYFIQSWIKYNLNIKR